MNIVYILFYAMSSSYVPQGYFSTTENCLNQKQHMMQKKVSYKENQLVCIPTGVTNDKFKAIKHKVI